MPCQYASLTNALWNFVVVPSLADCENQGWAVKQLNYKNNLQVIGKWTINAVCRFLGYLQLCEESVENQCNKHRAIETRGL